MRLFTKSILFRHVCLLTLCAQQLPQADITKPKAR